jgi:hypothetical protein
MLGITFYSELEKESVIVEVNNLIDPPHDCGIYQLQSTDCRYTFSTEQEANNMGWIRVK